MALLNHLQMCLMCYDDHMVVTVRNGIVPVFFHWKFILICLLSAYPYPGTFFRHLLLYQQVILMSASIRPSDL